MTLTIEWLNQIQLTIDSNRFYSSHFRGTEEKKKYQSTKRRSAHREEVRRSDGSPATRDSMSSSSSYQRGAHTCLHMCRSGDKRGQNVTVQPWSERSELGSSNHREHRARSVLSLSLSAHPSCRRVLDTEGARPGCNTRVYAIKSAGVPLLIG